MGHVTAVRHAVSRRSVAVGVMAVLIATIGMHVAPPSARAAGEVSVVASGGVSAGFGQSDTFSVAARDDGAGSLTGSVRMTRNGQPSDGTVACLAVDGGSIIVGGATTPSGPFPPPIEYFTLYLTDNGPTGTLDTVAFDGPTSTGPPDCGGPGPSQQPLSYGQVTILTGPSDSGTVSGHGTSPIGTFGTRTFDVDAQRAPDGTVTGTYDDPRIPGLLDVRTGRLSRHPRRPRHDRRGGQRPERLHRHPVRDVLRGRRRAVWLGRPDRVQRLLERRAAAGLPRRPGG